MKNKTHITILFLFTFISTCFLVRPNEQSDQTIKHGDLRKIAEEAVKMYGPGYYRLNSTCDIKTETVQMSGDYFGLNAGRIFHTVTLYDTTGAILSITKMWDNAKQPFALAFGNDVSIRFTEQVDTSKIQGTLRRNAFLRSQKYKIPYGTVTEQVAYQAPYPRRTISGEWDPIFIGKLRNYARNAQKSREILSTINSQESTIKKRWIEALAPKEEQWKFENSRILYSVQYHIDYQTIKNIGLKDSIDYFLKIDSTFSCGFFTQEKKIRLMTQLQLQNEVWQPTETLPVLTKLSDILSNVMLENKWDLCIVFVKNIPATREKSEIPLFAFKNAQHVFMCITSEYKCIPLREVLFKLYKN